MRRGESTFIMFRPPRYILGRPSQPLPLSFGHLIDRVETWRIRRTLVGFDAVRQNVHDPTVLRPSYISPVTEQNL